MRLLLGGRVQRSGADQNLRNPHQILHALKQTNKRAAVTTDKRIDLHDVHDVKQT